jgi:uncharacterized protein involved in exopolysaccharide biosynthesis
MVRESAFEESELRRHKRDLMIEPQPPATNDTSPSVSSLERVSGSADILEILLVLAREKKRILQITGALTLLATIVVFVMPKMYTATAAILPPQPNQSILNSLIGPGSAAVGSSLKDLGSKDPSDLFIAMLKSRTVEDALITKFDLLRLYNEKRYQDARKVLEKRSDIEQENETLILVKVSDRDPKRAADIANSWVDELQALNRSLAITEAAQRRVFFEQKMEAERSQLSQAEVELKQLQLRTGLIQPDVQGRELIGALAAVRAETAGKEVQLQSMRTYATENNPDVKRVETELAELRSQLARLASLDRNEAPVVQGSLQVPTRQVPESSLEYIRVARELRYHEGLYDFLGKQLEAARIDEAKNAIVVQVVDRAVPPEKQSSPRRLLIIVVSAVLSFFLACFGVLCSEAMRRKRQDPEDGARIAQLQHYLRNST